jgi:hypothetical protein
MKEEEEEEEENGGIYCGGFSFPLCHCSLVTFSFSEVKVHAKVGQNVRPQIRNTKPRKVLKRVSPCLHTYGM